MNNILKSLFIVIFTYALNLRGGGIDQTIQFKSDSTYSLYSATLNENNRWQEEWNRIKDPIYVDTCSLQIIDSTNLLNYLVNAECHLKSNQYNPEKAITLYLKALDLAETIKDNIVRCEIYKKLLTYYSFHYQDTTNFDKYLILHKKSAYSEYENYINEYFQFRYNMATAHITDEYPKFSTIDIENFLFRLDSIGFNKLKVETLSFSAVFETNTNNNTSLAISQNEDAIELAKNISESLANEIQFSGYSNIALAYINSGQYQQALEYLNYAESANLNLQNRSNRKLFYKWKSECLSKLNMPSEAYEYLLKSYDEFEKFHSNNFTSRVREIEERYQNEILANENIRLELDKVTLENRKKRDRYIVLSLIGILLILLVSLFIIRRFNKLKQLTLQQEINDTQQKAQISAINARLDGEEEERRRVASVLHDAIAGHLTAASFHLETMKASEDSTQLSRKAAGLIVEAAEQTRKLSHELYPPVLIKDGLIGAVKMLCEKYSNSDIQFGFINHWSNLTLSRDVESKVYFVIIELIQNILKHSGATKATLAFNQSIRDQLYVIIKDNGRGFDLEQKRNSLGLQTITSRIESLNGEIRYYTAYNHGTLVEFYIPVLVVDELR